VAEHGKIERRRVAAKRLEKQKLLQAAALKALFEKASIQSFNSALTFRTTSADAQQVPGLLDFASCGICGGNHFPSDNPAVSCASCGTGGHQQCWQQAGDNLGVASGNAPFCCGVCSAKSGFGGCEDLSLERAELASETNSKELPTMPILTPSIELHSTSPNDADKCSSAWKVNCALCRTAQGGLPMLVAAISDKFVKEIPPEYLLTTIRCTLSTQHVKLSGGADKSTQDTPHLFCVPVHAVCALLHKAIEWRSDVEFRSNNQQAQHRPDSSTVIAIIDSVIYFQSREQQAGQMPHSGCATCRNDFLPPEASKAARQVAPSYHYSCALRTGQLTKCKAEFLQPGCHIDHTLIPISSSQINMANCPPDAQLNPRSVCAAHPKAIKTLVRAQSGKRPSADSQAIWMFRMVPNLITFVDRTRVLVHPTHSHTCAGYIVPAGMLQGTRDVPCMYLDVIPLLGGLPLGIAYDFLDSRSSTVLHLASLGSVACYDAWLSLSATCTPASARPRSTGFASHEAIAIEEPSCLERANRQVVLREMLVSSVASNILRCFSGSELLALVQQLGANRKLDAKWNFAEIWESRLTCAAEDFDRAVSRVFDAKRSQRLVGAFPPSSPLHEQPSQSQQWGSHSVATSLQFLSSVLQTYCEASKTQGIEAVQNLLFLSVRAFTIQTEARVQHMKARFKSFPTSKMHVAFEQAAEHLLAWEVALGCGQARDAPSSNNFPAVTMPQEQTSVPDHVQETGLADTKTAALNEIRSYLVSLYGTIGAKQQSLCEEKKAQAHDYKTSSCTRIPTPPPRSKLPKHPVPVTISHLWAANLLQQADHANSSKQPSGSAAHALWTEGAQKQSDLIPPRRASDRDTTVKPAAVLRAPAASDQSPLVDCDTSIQVARKRGRSLGTASGRPAAKVSKVNKRTRCAQRELTASFPQSSIEPSTEADRSAKLNETSATKAGVATLGAELGTSAVASSSKTRARALPIFSTGVKPTHCLEVFPATGPTAATAKVPSRRRRRDGSAAEFSCLF
jgi:hypothetical protein